MTRYVWHRRRHDYTTEVKKRIFNDNNNYSLRVVQFTLHMYSIHSHTLLLRSFAALVWVCGCVCVCMTIFSLTAVNIIRTAARSPCNRPTIETYSHPQPLTTLRIHKHAGTQHIIIIIIYTCICVYNELATTPAVRFARACMCLCVYVCIYAVSMCIIIICIM